MTRPHISDAQRQARLAQRHRLAPGAHTDDIAGIADSLVALHSSDPATVHLAAVARMATPSIAVVEAALYEQRSVVRHHGMRRTLWVFTPEVARAVHASCTAALAAAEWKQLLKWVTANDLPDPQAWVAQARANTLAALHRLGPTSARALGKAVPALTTRLLMGTGKWAAEQASHTRLLLNLGFDAEIVRTAPTGSWVSSEYQWAVMADWLPGGITGMDPAAARDELVARYLQAFGPATAADVQWWTGWTLAPVKAALAALAAVEVGLDDGSVGWVLPDDVPGGAPTESEAAGELWVALLPGLDPTAMGWKQRGFYLGDLGTFGGPLFDRNGNVGPTVWANGQVVGGWAQRADGTVVFELLRPVDRATQAAIANAAERLRTVVGGTRVTPRFPTPLQMSLAVS
ncbi:MAG: winged helix DNA-binding domain-containing protein [Actinomycetota bacterium]|nr:winged helix DNA-binding domain-containing protein [Actinomycetota bacterium]